MESSQGAATESLGSRRLSGHPARGFNRAAWTSSARSGGCLVGNGGQPGCCFPIQSSRKSCRCPNGLVRTSGTSYGSRRDVYPGSFNLSCPDPLSLQIHSTSWLPQDLCRQRPWRQYSCSSCDRCRTQAGTGFEDSGLYLLDPA